MEKNGRTDGRTPQVTAFAGVVGINKSDMTSVIQIW